MPTPKLEQAIAAIKAGDRRTGQQLLAEVLHAEPHNDQAWLWLAGITRSERAQREYLERALAANPRNKAAQRGLAALPSKQAPPPSPVVAPSAPLSLTSVRRSKLPPLLLIGLPLCLLATACLGLGLWMDLPRQVAGAVTATPLPPPAASVPLISTANPALNVQAAVVATDPPTLTPRPTFQAPLTPGATPIFSPQDLLGTEAAVVAVAVEALAYASQIGPPCHFPHYPELEASSRPRMYTQADGLFLLYNFQAAEPVHLFVYDADGNLYHDENAYDLVDESGRSSFRLVDPAYNPYHVYVVVGSSSGEVVNTRGPVPCGSIREVSRLITGIDTTLINYNTQGQVINSQKVPQGTVLEEHGSRRANPDELWWWVSLDNGYTGWINDNQVDRYISPTPTPAPTPTPDPRLVAALPVITTYYGFLNQAQYERAWSMLSNDFKTRISWGHNREFTYADYVAIASQIGQVQLTQLEPGYLAGDRGTIYATITYSVRPGETDTVVQGVTLVWDPAR